MANRHKGVERWLIAEETSSVTEILFVSPHIFCSCIFSVLSVIKELLSQLSFIHGVSFLLYPGQGVIGLVWKPLCGIARFLCILWILFAITNGFLVCEVVLVVFGTTSRNQGKTFKSLNRLGSFVRNSTGIGSIYLVKFAFTRITCSPSIPLLSYSMFL